MDTTASTHYMQGASSIPSLPLRRLDFIIIKEKLFCFFSVKLHYGIVQQVAHCWSISHTYLHAQNVLVLRPSGVHMVVIAGFRILGHCSGQKTSPSFICVCSHKNIVSFHLKFELLLAQRIRRQVLSNPNSISYQQCLLSSRIHLVVNQWAMIPRASNVNGSNKHIFCCHLKNRYFKN